MEFESQEFMRVEQSLNRLSPKRRSESSAPPATEGAKGAKGAKSAQTKLARNPVISKEVDDIDQMPREGGEDPWWMMPWTSYYSQLAWGKLCSLLQPALNHHFSGSEILPGLWISDHASVCDLQSLQDRKIQHIICAVLGVKAMFPRYIQYTRLPLRDTHDEDIYRFLDQAADTINDVLCAGESILVHCRCGVSRSVTLVCAYLIKYQKMSPETAIHTIQKARPCANPIQSFRNQLRSYAEHQK